MSIEQANQIIGQMVMSYDTGYKLMRISQTPHGPYQLIKITKAGFAILKGREEFRIPPSLIELPK